jgi:low temperature requirement protein LtrA
MTPDQAPVRILRGLRQWFRTPPRRHGEVEYTREVSNLELFYDLVYVVLIGRAAHHLAEHLDGRGVLEFVIVFGLVWLAWFNGTLWHELHSREDGRSRLYIFTQMGLLALLAVFAGDAVGANGFRFALTYAVLFTLFTWQWYLVHRIDDPEYRTTTTRYLLAMLISVIAMTTSAFVNESARIWIWGLHIVMWVVGGLFLTTTDRTAGFGEGFTGSLVERIGLFTIIVLGEVVVGVVNGISDAEEQTVMTISTGIIGLTIGMGMWWNYFDILGRRVPGEQGGRLAGWLFAHLPLTMSIAAGGAAMVSLVEHAAEDRTPVATAWLLTGSAALVLMGVTIAAQALPVDSFPTGMRQQIAPTFMVAAVVILGIGSLRLAPIALVLAVSLVLALVWFRLFFLLLALGGNPAKAA